MVWGWLKTVGLFTFAAAAYQSLTHARPAGGNLILAMFLAPSKPEAATEADPGSRAPAPHPLQNPLQRREALANCGTIELDREGRRWAGQRTGFVVLKGSQAVLQERASAHQYPYTLASRNKLIEDGTLMQDGDSLKFTQDAEFSSPSAAATVVHGGSANGLVAWKNSVGKTLKELEATRSG